MNLSPTATRSEVLRTARQLREAAQLLETHARHCPVSEAPAHATALQRARGMVRALVGAVSPRGTSEEARYGHE